MHSEADMGLGLGWSHFNWACLRPDIVANSEAAVVEQADRTSQVQPVMAQVVANTTAPDIVREIWTVFLLILYAKIPRVLQVLLLIL